MTRDWPGISLEGQVFYELHVGTFTAEGTWASAARRLDRLRALGITTIQLMPIADFAGDFGWGYDGVNWFAPTRLYGRPDEVRAFVDAAHARGLGVILDAVYNHLGPDGNYLATLRVRVLHRPLRKRLGPGAELRRSGRTGHARARPRQRRALDSRVSPRRLPARRDAADFRLVARPYPRCARAARARCRGRPADRHHRRERAARRPPGAARGERRIRAGRRLQRRLPPLGPCRADQRPRSVLQRFSRHESGASVGGEARVPVPGTAIRVAGQAPWNGCPRSRAASVRPFSREPRPGRQLGRRPQDSASSPRQESCGR